MISLTVNGRRIPARPGELLINAMSRSGINVPALCHIPELKPDGACRLCLVEIEGHEDLIPSCSFQVTEGLVVHTHSPRVLRARKTILQLLLQHHPNDCLFCAKNNSCKLRILANEYHVRPQGPQVPATARIPDHTGDTMSFDPAKCIVCGNCARICNDKLKIGAVDYLGRGQETFIGTAYKAFIGTSECIECGQCAIHCPTGALQESDAVPQVTAALSDPELYPVIQYPLLTAGAVAEFFGIRPGRDISGQLNAALRQIGFKAVCGMGFGWDLLAEENAAELAKRIRDGKRLPLISNRTSALIRYVLQYFPALFPLMSPCRSIQGITGTLMRRMVTERKNIDPGKIYTVAATPCLSKKTESMMPLFEKGKHPDTNAVITVRELIRLLQLHGIELKSFVPEPPDIIYGKRKHENGRSWLCDDEPRAVARALCRITTGHELEAPEFEIMREEPGLREICIRYRNFEFKYAALDGLGAAREFFSGLSKHPRTDLHYVNVMVCSGGCFHGTGLPHGINLEKLQTRMENLNPLEMNRELNPDVQAFYRDYLKDIPGGKKAADLFHIKFKVLK